jgi:outer membrane protein assembly factor BamB
MALFVSDAAWLPVGTNVVRFDPQGNARPVDTDLVRVDPTTGTVTARVPLSGPGSFTFRMGDSIIVKTTTGADVVSTKTLRRERELPGGRAYAFGSIWDVRDGTLLRINPTSGKITGRLLIQAAPGWEPQLTAARGAVWIGLGDRHSVVRVNPRTMRRTASMLLAAADSLVVVGFGYGYLWAHQNADGPGKLYRIDPATNRVTDTIPLGDPNVGSSGLGGTNLAFANDSVWTCDSSGTVTQVGAASGQVQTVRKLPFDDTCEWIAVGAGSIWVSNDAEANYPITVRLQI